MDFHRLFYMVTLTIVCCSSCRNWRVLAFLDDDDGHHHKKVIIHLPVQVKHVTRTIYKVIKDKGGGDHHHKGEVLHRHLHSGKVDHVHKHEAEAKHKHQHIGTAGHIHKHTADVSHHHAHTGHSDHKHSHAGQFSQQHAHHGAFGHAHKHQGKHEHGHSHTAHAAHAHHHSGKGTHSHSHLGHFDHGHGHHGAAGHHHQHLGHLGNLHEHAGVYGHAHTHHGTSDNKHWHSGHYGHDHAHVGKHHHDHHHKGHGHHDHLHHGHFNNEHLYKGVRLVQPPSILYSHLGYGLYDDVSVIGGGRLPSTLASSSSLGSDHQLYYGGKQLIRGFDNNEFRLSAEQQHKFVGGPLPTAIGAGYLIAPEEPTLSFSETDYNKHVPSGDKFSKYDNNFKHYDDRSADSFNSASGESAEDESPLLFPTSSKFFFPTESDFQQSSSSATTSSEEWPDNSSYNSGHDSSSHERLPIGDVSSANAIDNNGTVITINRSTPGAYEVTEPVTPLTETPPSPFLF